MDDFPQPQQSFPSTPAPQTFQGYGEAQYPQYGGWEQHHGGGFGFLLFLLLGGFVLFQIARRRMFWSWRANANGSPSESRRNGFFDAVPSSGSNQDQALAIARKRLANGEISPEEFEIIRKGLTS
jgi:uncharacterized membrane protein